MIDDVEQGFEFKVTNNRSKLAHLQVFDKRMQCIYLWKSKMNSFFLQNWPFSNGLQH